jgi:hypothetical protein
LGRELGCGDGEAAVEGAALGTEDFGAGDAAPPGEEPGMSFSSVKQRRHELVGAISLEVEG